MHYVIESKPIKRLKFTREGVEEIPELVQKGGIRSLLTREEYEVVKRSFSMEFDLIFAGAKKEAEKFLLSN